jgi:CheY-like chemotaxis protein
MSKAPLISIVDDDALARDGICELVESLGYKATTFESAEHFLKSRMLAETTCLITDVTQGYQTPVILVTAYPNEIHRTRALDNGAVVGYLSKPFDEESLIKCRIAAITTPARAVKGLITLGSTTSMQDSGLLGHILPLFRAATVFAAASMRNALDDVDAAFTKQTALAKAPAVKREAEEDWGKSRRV